MMVMRIERMVISLLGACACLLTGTGARAEQQDAPPAGPFEQTIESLKQYECPEWFRDAKFGIYVHWGPYSVAEAGVWYPRLMYVKGQWESPHHRKHWGHPSEFGYNGADPKNQGIYHPPHPHDSPTEAINAPPAWRENWYKRLKEPDFLLSFSGAINDFRPPTPMKINKI